MNSYTFMDRYIRKNDIYIILLFVLCGVIPHVMLSLLRLASTSDKWSPAETETYSNFIVCQWIPFWLAFVSYLRLQKRDNFSFIPAVSAIVIIITYLPRYEQHSVVMIAFTVPLILAVELSGFLKIAESSTNTFLRAIAADRAVLRAFFFWSVVFPGVIFISCGACTWQITVVSPFQMLPIPGVLLFDVFRHQKAQPPTIWGFIGMLAFVPLSLFLVTIGPMEKFAVYHLMNLGLGFAVLFLMLVVYNIDQWKKLND